jgi:hypothetical protein
VHLVGWGRPQQRPAGLRLSARHLVKEGKLRLDRLHDPKCVERGRALVERERERELKERSFQALGGKKSRDADFMFFMFQSVLSAHPNVPYVREESKRIR